MPQDLEQQLDTILSRALIILIPSLAIAESLNKLASDLQSAPDHQHPEIYKHFSQKLAAFKDHITADSYPPDGKPLRVLIDQFCEGSEISQWQASATVLVKALAQRVEMSRAPGTANDQQQEDVRKFMSHEFMRLLKANTQHQPPYYYDENIYAELLALLRKKSDVGVIEDMLGYPELLILILEQVKDKIKTWTIPQLLQQAFSASQEDGVPGELRIKYKLLSLIALNLKVNGLQGNDAIKAILEKYYHEPNELLVKLTYIGPGDLGSVRERLITPFAKAYLRSIRLQTYQPVSTYLDYISYSVWVAGVVGPLWLNPLGPLSGVARTLLERGFSAASEGTQNAQSLPVQAAHVVAATAYNGMYYFNTAKGAVNAVVSTAFNMLTTSPQLAIANVQQWRATTEASEFGYEMVIPEGFEEFEEIRPALTQWSVAGTGLASAVVEEDDDFVMLESRRGASASGARK